MAGPLSVKPHAASVPPPPLREHGDACTLVLLGVTGDLARRKLLGCVYNLFASKLVPHGFRLLGVDRLPMDDEAFRDLAKRAVSESDEVRGFDEATWAELSAKLFYAGGDLTQPEVYADIAKRLLEIEGNRVEKSDNNRMFYLSVPPFVFQPIVRHLSQSGIAPMTDDASVRPWSRVVVEKPFGTSLATSTELSSLVLGLFNEHQIYRIDHYLGKETVQNVLVFRAANAIFEPVWNRNHIASVQITAAETVGVEGRGKYYETAGVVRDMIQNHLLQLLALTAMELPTRLEANRVRDEKVKALRAVRPFGKNVGDVAVRAQYAQGKIKDKDVPGYRQEPDVFPESTTPTFTAMKFMIDNGRWRGVPFYVRSGKRMAKRVTEIALQFHKPAYRMEELVGLTPTSPLEPNVLVIRVQPNDGITLRFDAKVPGSAMQLTPEIEVAPVDMDFTYAEAFGADLSPAYETLLLDVMLGDATLFTRSDEVETGWKITDPLLDFWAQNPPRQMPTYAAGSWGPPEAHALVEKDGYRWREP